MKKISLGRNHFALVDNTDYDWLNQWEWHFLKSRNTFYAYAYVSINDEQRKTIQMHRLLLGLKIHSPKQADHIDGNGLNNCRANLRSCTPQQNQFNRRSHKGSKSQFKGVYWRKDVQKWQASIRYNGHNYGIGYFTNETDAAHAYDKKAQHFFKEFARLNFPVHNASSGIA